ncbi:MAG: lysozyme inhibitor LprI family protein [Methylocella sp.]
MVAAQSAIVRADDSDDGTPAADCQSLQTLALPRADAAGAAQRAALQGCNSEALYFGLGVPKAAARARQCAYLERKTPGNGWPNLFAGTGMLMTIYANGVGATRNLDLALKFACELNGAPAEEEGWIAHLQKLKNEHWEGRDFNPCDDVTSGAAQGFCAAHDAKLATAIANWSSEERHAFAALQKAKDGYVTAEADNEVDMSGTARGAFYVEAKEAGEDRFLAVLQGLTSDDFPRAPPDFAAADAKLNALYRKIQGSRGRPNWGTVTKDGIRKTQRAWLRYRDAWVDFAKIKFPSLSHESLQAVLTEDRIKLLEGFTN